MSLLLKFRCRLGFHKWQDWQYVAADNCNQVRTCVDCWAKRTRAAWHDWKWQPSSDNPCEELGTCQHCQLHTTRIEHDLTDWTEETTEEESGEVVGIAHGCDTTVTPYSRYSTYRVRSCQRPGCSYSESELIESHTSYGETYCE